MARLPFPEEWEVFPHNYTDKPFELSSKLLGFDVETTGLDVRKDYLLSYSVSDEPYKAVGNKINTRFDNYLHKIICSKNNILTGSNIKFDVLFIENNLKQKVECQLLDTAFLAFLVDENSQHGLKYLAKLYTELEDYAAAINRAKITSLSNHELLTYNMYDADASRQVAIALLKRVDKLNMMPLAAIGSQVLKLLCKMEQRGIKINKARQAELSKTLSNKAIDDLYKMKVIAATPFHPTRPRELAQVLFRNLEFTRETYTETGQTKVDDEAIKILYDEVKESQNDKQRQFLDTLTSFRKTTKLLSTYVEPVSDWIRHTGRVHTTFALGRPDTGGGTVTGRLSSRNPNLQNIVRGESIRSMFIPDEGYVFYDADYSQLELRLIAYLAQEPAMLECFDSNFDIHTSTFAKLQNIPYEKAVSMLSDESHQNYQHWKNLRVGAKSVNFGIPYGISAKALQRQLWQKFGINWSTEQCEEMIIDWLARYPKIKKFIGDTHYEVITQGFVTNLLGQRRRLPNAGYGQWEKERLLKQAVNFKVQSLASWVTMCGMLLLDKYLPGKGEILLQVHDSILMQILKELDMKKTTISEIMTIGVAEYIEQIFKITIDVPLDVKIEVSETWK